MESVESLIVFFLESILNSDTVGEDSIRKIDYNYIFYRIITNLGGGIRAFCERFNLS